MDGRRFYITNSAWRKKRGYNGGGCGRALYKGASAEVHGSSGEKGLTWKDQNLLNP